MVKGDRVVVYPHGSPKQRATATVIMISDNGRSIAVAFADKPPFATDKSGGVTIHRQYGIVMMAMRHALDGVAWGPWVELQGGGHYEIEELK